MIHSCSILWTTGASADFAGTWIASSINPPAMHFLRESLRKYCPEKSSTKVLYPTRRMILFWLHGDLPLQRWSPGYVKAVDRKGKGDEQGAVYPRWESLILRLSLSALYRNFGSCQNALIFYQYMLFAGRLRYRFSVSVAPTPHGVKIPRLSRPERRPTWASTVLGVCSALLVTTPLLHGHRSPPQPHALPVGPSARLTGAPGSRPPLPAPRANPETGLLPPGINMPRPEIFPKNHSR